MYGREGRREGGVRCVWVCGDVWRFVGCKGVCRGVSGRVEVCVWVIRGNQGRGLNSGRIKSGNAGRVGRTE